MRYLLLALVVLAGAASAQTYTEFYADNSATGCGGSACSNLNAGSTVGAPVVSVTSRTWTQATRTLLVASTSGVTTGMFMSVFPDGTTGDTVYICRISTVNVNTSLVCGSTPVAGTAPVDGTSNRSAIVGGSWAGPGGASWFPFTLPIGNLTNVAGNVVRINIKSGTAYSVTATATTHSTLGPSVIQGYTSTVGDGGRAVFDGGSPATSFVMLTISAVNTFWADLTFQNNVQAACTTCGTSDGIAYTASRSVMRRVVVAGMAAAGINSSGTNVLEEVEAYGNDVSNTASTGGIVTGVASILIRPYCHDNATANANGIVTGGVAIIDPILDSNGKNGIFLTSASAAYTVIGGAFYNNGAAGIATAFGSGTFNLYVENAAFALNGTYGINLTGTSPIGLVANVAYGSGTFANASGTINSNGATYLNLVSATTLASNLSPWAAPSTGNFTVSASAMKGVGRGGYTETGNSKTGTTAFPDIGTGGQHQDTGGGGTVGHPMGH